MAFSDAAVEILKTLFSAQAEKTPREHRVFTFHYNEATKAGQRTMNAARDLEATGLVRVVPGHLQANIFQIFPRC